MGGVARTDAIATPLLVDRGLVSWAAATRTHASDRTLHPALAAPCARTEAERHAEGGAA
jgi:hypothetical protein